MNEDEYHALSARLRSEDDHALSDVSPDMLADQSDRVLLYGFTVHRDTFVVRLENGLFVGHCYSSSQAENPPVAWRSASPDEKRPAFMMAPNKRIYPDRSDAEFLDLLHRSGATVSLTKWTS